MNFVYAASVMGLGDGRRWHRKYSFPSFPRITKTITEKPRNGTPFFYARKGKTVWNRNGLCNPGIFGWLNKFVGHYDLSNIILSLSGDDEEIARMISFSEHVFLSSGKQFLNGIELNFSCPNIKQNQNKEIPNTIIPIDLKLRYNQDPYNYDLSKIRMIRLNSVPCKFGAVSGKAAQEKNWRFIRTHAPYLPISGCSWTDKNEIQELRKMGVSEISIGSVILNNPKLIERLIKDQ